MTLAILVTWLGIALAVGLFDPEVVRRNIVGSALVIVCAATMAFYLMVTERVTRHVNGPVFTGVAMTAAGLCFAIQFVLTGDVSSLAADPQAWWLMAGLIVFATVLPLVLMAEGVRRIGAQRGAIVSTIGPPATIIIAAWLLDERLDGTQIAGVALIMAGILALELRRWPFRPTSEP